MFRFVMCVLAAWRLAHMVAREDGPFDLFDRLRDGVDPTTTLGRGIRCPLCVGVYAAALFVALEQSGRAGSWLLVRVFAVAGGQSLAQRWYDKNDAYIELG